MKKFKLTTTQKERTYAKFYNCINKKDIIIEIKYSCKNFNLFLIYNSHEYKVQGVILIYKYIIETFNHDKLLFMVRVKF
jgi:hypothetical protein